VTTARWAISQPTEGEIVPRNPDFIDVLWGAHYLTPQL